MVDTSIPVRWASGSFAAVLLWLLLLAAVLASPYLLDSPTAGDDQTRNTVRLSLLYYAAAVGLMLLLRPDEWRGDRGRGRLARWCWTLGWLAYLVHLVMAFHYFHRWSHAAAMEHVRQAAGLGEGIFASHLFTLLWTADVLWWWLWPERYAHRSPWIDRLLHGFLAFMVFQGTVVFESGFIRWFGAALFAALAGLALWRRFGPHNENR